jgi:hypothetical protein
MTYVAPNPKLRMFTCPHCGVLARFYKWGYQNKLNCRPIPESLLSDEIEISSGNVNTARNFASGMTISWYSRTEWSYHSVIDMSPVKVDITHSAGSDETRGLEFYVLMILP